MNTSENTSENYQLSLEDIQKDVLHEATKIWLMLAASKELPPKKDLGQWAWIYGIENLEDFKEEMLEGILAMYKDSSSKDLWRTVSDWQGSLPVLR